MRRPSPAERTLLPRNHPGRGGTRTRPSPSLLRGHPEDPALERKGTLAIHSLILPDQHPHLPPTERSARACARAVRLGHHPYRSLHDSQAVRQAPPTGSRWSRRSLRRVAGGPDGNARSAADMGSDRGMRARLRRAQITVIGASTAAA
jgi:hypothetical protein